MKNVLAIACLMLSSAFVYAQKDTTYWTKSGLAALNGSQTQLSNWSGGGDNTHSINSMLNYKIKYEKAKNAWENNLDFAYGIVNTNKEYRKGDDKIDLSSKYGHQATKHWYYSALLTFKSQFDKGYEYDVDDTNMDSLISNFMAPGNVYLTLGMDYKPNDNFSLLLSPLTARWILVLDQTLADRGAFGVDPGENLRYEMGTMLKMVYENKEIIKNVGFKTKLELFSDYTRRPQNIDVNWEVFIDFKINKFMSATLNTQLVYDDDTQINGTNSLVQFKEILGVGLSYKF